MSEKLQAIVDQVAGLTVLELSELVKMMEEKFGVQAAAPMMMAGMMPMGAAGAGGSQQGIQAHCAERRARFHRGTSPLPRAHGRAGGLKAQPLFWTSTGMAHVPVDNDVSFQWNGKSFEKLVQPHTD